MNRNMWKLALGAVVAGAVWVAPASIAQSGDDAAENEQDEAAAGEEAEQESEFGEEIVVLGSRSAEPRSVADSPVPVTSPLVYPPPGRAGLLRPYGG